MGENPSDKKMSMAWEASRLVRRIAEPATGKAALLRAYRRLGTWTYNRVKDVYYGDERVRISGEEIDKLRAIARLETASNDPSIKDLRDQLAAVVRHLKLLDPTFCDPLVEEVIRPAHSDSGEETTSGAANGD